MREGAKLHKQRDLGGENLDTRECKVGELTTLAEVQMWTQKVLVSLSAVKQQIADGEVEGVSPAWLAKAKGARRALGALHQHLMRRGAELAKVERQVAHAAQHDTQAEEARAFDRAFRNVVGERFGQEVFSEIVVEARRRLLKGAGQ